MRQVHLPVESRRLEFILAAIKVIEKLGVEGATTRRIAEAAGLPHANLHYCFSSKVELFEAVYAWASDIGFSSVRVESTRGRGVVHGAEVLFRSFAKWAEDYPGHQIVMFELTLWASHRPESRHLAERANRRFVDGCAQILREAKLENENVDVNMLATALLNTLDGIVFQRISIGEFNSAALVDAAVSCFQAGIRCGVYDLEGVERI